MRKHFYKKEKQMGKYNVGCMLVRNRRDDAIALSMADLIDDAV